MKRVFIALMILAASAAFAKGINDPSVTVSGWREIDDSEIVISDLQDDNGFTVSGGRYASSTYYMAGAEGWLYDPNETVTVSVSEDFGSYMFGGREIEDVYVIVGAADINPQSGQSEPNYVLYGAQYNGPGDYTLPLFRNTGISEGDTLNAALFSLSDETGYYAVDMPAYSTLTVRFNADKPETEVPEPGVCAYALTGIAALSGIKRRIRK